MAQPSPYALSQGVQQALAATSAPPGSAAMPVPSDGTSSGVAADAATRAALSDFMYVVSAAASPGTAAPPPAPAAAPPAGAGGGGVGGGVGAAPAPIAAPAPPPPHSAGYGYASTPASAAAATPDVFSRLTDPESFTGVYGEMHRSGPGINHAFEPGRAPRGHAFPVATHLHDKVATYLSSGGKHPNPQARAARDVGYRDGLPYWNQHESPRDRAKRKSTLARRPPGFSSTMNDGNYAKLYLIFCYYCAFGLTGANKAKENTICNVNFAKFTRECPDLLDSDDRIAGSNKGLNPTEVDMIFIQCKPAKGRRLTYKQFLAALDRMAQVKYPRDEPGTAFSRLLHEHVFKCEGARVVEMAESQAQLGGSVPGTPATDRIASEPVSPYPAAYTPGGVPSRDATPAGTPVGAGSYFAGPPAHHADHSSVAAPTPAAGAGAGGVASGGVAGMPPPATPGSVYAQRRPCPNCGYVDVGDGTPMSAALPPSAGARPPSPGSRSLPGGSRGHRRRGSSMSRSVVSEAESVGTIRRANVADARRMSRAAHYAAPPRRRKTIAGEANRPGGVYDRLSSPATFTGVYRRAWFSDGRINHYADTMVSNIPSSYEGDTNTGTNEIITDISVLLRPGLRYGKNLKV